MNSQRQSPKAWRTRAEHLRELAVQARDEVTRQQLNELADTWETMADRAERHFGADIIRVRDWPNPIHRRAEDRQH
ncbi:MAG: hypothetical protein FJX64_08600 [Alphaproteobacteria bacterium]|nr:hypothetical protein [Alphaproteobacteria bacterium]